MRRGGERAAAATGEESVSQRGPAALGAGALTGGAPEISASEASTLAEIAQRAGGVSLGDARGEFFRLRLGPRLRETGCERFADYIAKLSGPGAEAERRHLVEAVATHTTSFFRERRHYEHMQSVVLPERHAAGVSSRPLEIWSAASSTGAELWSALMAVQSWASERGLRSDCRGVGTDISARILRRAENAVFAEDEIVGIPDEMARRYLLRRRGASPKEPSLYRIVPELRERARFLQANLLSLQTAPSFMADICFLRNVLIYFEPADRLKAVAGVVSRLRTGGILYTGHTESLGNDVPSLRQEGAAIYRRI